MYQNIWHEGNLPWGKFIALNIIVKIVIIGKKDIKSITAFKFKKIVKEEKTKIKESRRKKMVIRGEIKEINYRKTIEEINQKLNYCKNQQIDSP